MPEVALFQYYCDRSQAYRRDAASQPPVWRAQFSNDSLRFFVVTHSDKDTMPQMPCISPFNECDLADDPKAARVGRALTA